MGASPACLDLLPLCEPDFTALFPSLRKNPEERMSYLKLMVSVHGKGWPALCAVQWLDGAVWKRVASQGAPLSGPCMHLCSSPLFTCTSQACGKV